MPMGRSAGQAMVAIIGLALRDNLKTRNDFPAQRERGSLLSSVCDGCPDRTTTARRETGTGFHRQGIEDDLQRGRVCHMPVTLTVDKFGLNSERLWLR